MLSATIGESIFLFQHNDLQAEILICPERKEFKIAKYYK